MNKLYLRTVEYDVFDKNGQKIVIDKMAKIHYGEMPNRRFNELTFDDLYCNYGSRFLFWKGIDSRCHFGDYVAEEAFGSAIQDIYYEEIDESFYTIQNLMKELPSKEFIAYCKDNGLNVCPMR